MKLDGKVAFVSGAARGIGLAISKAFAAEGAKVAMADIDAALVDEAAREVGAAARGFALDVSDPVQTETVIEQAADAFGRLDILMSGAAILSPALPITELSIEDWNAAISVNLSGSFHICKYGIPHLQAAGGGSIILVASQMGRVAWPGSTAYCTTKGGLLQLAKGIALDHAADGIRANTLSPGGTATRRLSNKFGDMETAQSEWGPKHPLGRLGEPEEIAAGAVYLASADSSFMTGTDLLLDGGYSAW